MTYNYCPNCGIEFRKVTNLRDKHCFWRWTNKKGESEGQCSNCLHVFPVDPHGQYPAELTMVGGPYRSIREAEDAMPELPKPPKVVKEKIDQLVLADRLAELREKYEGGWIPSADPSGRRNDGTTQAVVPFDWANSACGAIKELLAMLEARPKITDSRLGELREKYGPTSAYSHLPFPSMFYPVEWVQRRIAADAIGELRGVINELLDMLEAKETPITDERLLKLFREWCGGSEIGKRSQAPGPVIIELIGEIERLKNIKESR